MQIKPNFRFLLLCVLAGALSTARGLVITPVWDSTIANDPNAATIEATINSAIEFYEARFADPMSISIQFQEMSGGLGQSQWTFYQFSYLQYYQALQSDATTTNDTYALSFLPGGIDNPVTGDFYMNIHTATLKALGFTGYDAGLPNGVEGIVSLNTGIMSLSRSAAGSAGGSGYDLLSVAEHEMDEVLGLGSWLGTGLTDFDDPFPEDLFRYDTNGNRSFTTSGDDAWFSLDGMNFLVQFNQLQNEDYGDWWSTSRPAVPRVQDAIIYSGDTPNPNVELVALDVIGYDLLPPPQPGIASIGINGTNLVVNGTNGLATAKYHLLTSTNLALPLNKWSLVWTNAPPDNGNFTFTATNVVTSHTPGRFYLLQLQP